MIFYTNKNFLLFNFATEVPCGAFEKARREHFSKSNILSDFSKVFAIFNLHFI
jgi:hypothetical protein